VGLQYSINGSNIYYAGGGGGGGTSAGGVGGLGGGGHGGNRAGSETAGTNGLGGGGGSGAIGGSGVVVIRYENPVIEVVTTLNSPIDYYNSTLNTITFNCSAVTNSFSGGTIQNISLYGNWTGTYILNETLDFNGNTKETAIFTKNIPSGTYSWNCIGKDNTTSAWATANRTFNIPIFCTFQGYVKDRGGVGLDGANVLIINSNNLVQANTTTDSNGYWNYNILNGTGNYSVMSYYNNTISGYVKPYIQSLC